MKLWQIWGITFLIAAAYLTLCAELDYRAALTERCKVVNCA
ncbi:hypothetical protein [Caballeronia sp. GAFFF3]|nr:hypothetical protein [Caballeronia sp. GAFFF3]